VVQWLLVSGVDSARAGKQIDPLYALNVDHSHPEKQRFFCNTEQSYLTQVPWLYFHGCLYFLPKLFAIPAFRTPLEALFPDPSLALTNLLRTVMLPNDYVWQTVKQHDDTLFKNADQRVGIQVSSSLCNRIPCISLGTQILHFQSRPSCTN
jgi:xyloglucan fucosyltransferase